MGLLGIDHINIDTPSIDDTVTFYTDVFGLESRPKPSGNPGVWLYLGEQAIVHVNPVDDQPSSTGLFNHVAFMGEDFETVTDRLDEAGFAYRVQERADLNRSQIFVHDPNGILLEITFDQSA